MNKTLEEQMQETISELREALNVANNPVPPGCARGAWCRHCDWSRPFRVYRSGTLYDLTWECMKGSCESFIPKKESEPK